ncbi:acetyltransferase [Enterobacter hormaechei]|uniref:PglD-related sugar-binding protein n=1 Tax=Enterobacter hormaechei TaxID=158836 RepID=UPI0012552A7D|nr:sugar O-acyltransferase [Enterobacter hormaechei]MEA3809192.1 sugar O-acyltransferase [Enterobacter hormaechei]MEA3818365.1 sugar O-acyltransferase [Enterobacter hormaechei]VAC28308.1 acetyltransferase [Enterobacter hormaechei]VAE42669.1 acetyltransferase [Enterobacter hormaechei]VAF71763.1 acetyltransferase [Enterobacter hormaechei]
MHNLLILGAGGHGRTLSELATILGYAGTVFLDDNASTCPDTNKRIIGKISELRLHINKASHVAIGIGNNKVREELYCQLINLSVKPVTLIHPNAFISPSATISDGSVILAGAVVGANAKLGAGTIINSHSTVDHDCILRDFAHLGVGVHLAGGAIIGKSAFLQAGTVGGYNTRVDDYSVCPAGTIL